MTVQLNIRLEPEQKEKLAELAKADNKTITAYILDKTIFAETVENAQEDTSSTRIDVDNNRIDSELYKALIEQLDRKDEQIINLQKIIYNKDTKLLEYSQKKSFWKAIKDRFW
ncbi:DUF1778 domain-containing protein [Streptococcus suis]|uniref:type II toxin -antitoxin system TacA 1-like antitoxin n=1 Tax=Streptococcus suis TaxID=1307 RepID=UPI0015561257|nr:DUF1778 domain-containing protein [Streptococcus suis]NQM39456.1 DUF1778 domain-containing protein [Streptococcus suis]